MVTVRLERQDAIAIATLDNPPVNALGHALRQGLADVIAEVAADPTVHALVLLAAGQTFPAGADIAEFGHPPRAPTLPDLCDLLEASGKPVVAGLHGSVLGGGLELALAAHHRVALGKTRFGFPEVGLGILPGAGGTQRAPRLIGAAATLRLMLTGQPIGAAEAIAMGLVDRVVAGDLRAAAIEMARDARVRPTRALSLGMHDAAAYGAAVAAARRAASDDPLPGPGRIVDCVEAAQLLPFDRGLAYERAAFVDLVATPEAGALRHLFFAERRAARMPASDGTARKVATVTICGTGAEAVTLSLSLVRAGVIVTMVGASRHVLAPALEQVAAALEADVTAARIAEDQRAEEWDRLVPALADAPGDACDLLFLADEFAKTDAMSVPPGVPTVTLGVEGADGPGLILAPLAPGGRLAELLVGPGTLRGDGATLGALMRRVGRVPVRSRGAGIGAPVMAAMRAALRHLDDSHGATPTMDVLRRWGMVADNGSQSVLHEDPFSGLAPRVLGAMANAGLCLLGDAQVSRPSDVDVAVVLGHGLPRRIGGPMLWAHRRGLLVLREDLRLWAEEAPSIWTPAPILDALIGEGVTLAALNEA